MNDLIEKGDLVRIKGLDEKKVGIVVEIIRRSDQNDDWSELLVLIDDETKKYSPRRLIPTKRRNSE